MRSAKQDVESLLHKLSDTPQSRTSNTISTSSTKDVVSSEDVRVKGTLSPEEAKTRLKKWLTE